VPEGGWWRAAVRTITHQADVLVRSIGLPARLLGVPGDGIEGPQGPPVGVGGTPR
jgi:hypothetical protein